MSRSMRKLKGTVCHGNESLPIAYKSLVRFLHMFHAGLEVIDCRTHLVAKPPSQVLSNSNWKRSLTRLLS